MGKSKPHKKISSKFKKNMSARKGVKHNQQVRRSNNLQGMKFSDVFFQAVMVSFSQAHCCGNQILQRLNAVTSVRVGPNSAHGVLQKPGVEERDQKIWSQARSVHTHGEITDSHAHRCTIWSQ